MKKYIDYMYRFGITDLKSYLGTDLLETLIEWLPEGDALLTHNRLINMIDAIYGTKIFQNKNFRKDMLCSMEIQDFFDIRDFCLVGDEKKENDPMKLIELIAAKPWSKSKLTDFLTDKWGLSPDIFEKETDISTTKSIIQCKERFFELLDYQYYIKQRILNNLNSDHMQERMLVHMPTGTGKTKTTMHTITNYIEFTLKKNGIVVWIAHTTELLQQAYETFQNVWEHLGDGAINTYKLWGNHSMDDLTQQLNGVVFCGLIRERSPETFERLKKDCRLIIFDEAHKAAAPKTQQVIEELLRMPRGYENRALIGLTATPGRTTEDSYDNELLSHMFGNKLIHIDTEILNQINYGQLKALNTLAAENIIKYFQERKILSKMKTIRLQYETNYSKKDLQILQSTLVDMGYNEKDFTEKQLKIFAKNKNRNKVIMENLRRL